MPGKRVQFDDVTWNARDLLAKDRMQDFQELADEAFSDILVKHGRPTDLNTALRKSVAGMEKRPPAASVERGAGRKSAGTDRWRQMGVQHGTVTEKAPVGSRVPEECLELVLEVGQVACKAFIVPNPAAPTALSLAAPALASRVQATSTVHVTVRWQVWGSSSSDVFSFVSLNLHGEAPAWWMLRRMKRGDRVAVLLIAIALVAAAVLGYFVAGWMFGTH
jgi:hypothetical protein